MGFSFWPFKWKKAEKQPSESTLPDIVRGIQHAVNSAQEIAEQQYFRLIERYFYGEGGDETNPLYEGMDKAKPLYKTFLLPNDNKIDLPLIAIVPPNGIRLNNMRVHMSVRLDDARAKKAAPQEEEEKTDLTRTSFKVSLAPTTTGRETRRPGNVIDLDMEFIAGDPPEAVARLIEQYTNLVAPQPVEKESET